jgi:hypothetical protein
MSRRLERIIIYIASAWQIITGAITAGLYLFNLDMTLGAGPTTSMFGTFIFTYGMAYVTLGLINIILTNKFVEDNTIQNNMITFWIILAVSFLILADYVSLMLLVLAITIALAKNKPIKLNKMNSSV